MAERRRTGQPARARALPVALVRDHRVNDLVLGHVGRLTYVSAENNKNENNNDDDDEDNENDDDGTNNKAAIGKLLTNRFLGSVYTFQEVARFQEWFPPTATDISGVRTVPQMYLKKLLADAPDTLEGVAGTLYPAFVQEAQESELFQSPQTRLPLLSYGEITDMSGREPVARPALAMPTGQSGHALRIVLTRGEDWGWHVEGNVTMNLTNIDREDEGHWCDNALSINQIKFTAGSSYHSNSSARNNVGSAKSTKRPLRWILAQTAAETIIFQATMHGLPVQRKRCACDNVNRGLTYITVEPIIRIPISDTGNRAHCDVTFNPATETRPPQIAIIDEAGQWTVWNITGNRHVRKNIFLPFLYAKGTFADSSLSGSSILSQDLGHLHRISWLPKAADDGPQSTTLLISNATSVSVIGVDTKDTLLRTFNAVHSVGVDIVLDVQISPLNKSHIFVLTTTAIFWLDLSPLQTTRLQSKGTPSKSSKEVKKKQSFVLLSCPHLRGPGDNTVKLSLASVKSDHGDDVIVALVYSTKYPEVAVFWFQQASSGQESTYQQHVFPFARPQFSSPDNKPTSSVLGQQTMVLLTKPIRVTKPNPRLKGSLGIEYAQNGVCVFQVLALGTDLSFWSSICVSSSAPSALKLDPFLLVMKRRHGDRSGVLEKRRQAGSKHVRSCFVVSDEFEDHLLNEDAAIKASKFGSASFNDGRSSRPLQVHNMARLYNLLNKYMDKAAVSAYQATDMVRGFQNPSPLDIVRQIIDIASEHGSFAYTTLLNISNYEYILEYGADLTDFSWTRQLADLDIGSIEDSRVSISSLMPEAQARSGDAPTLYDAMSELCLIHRVGDGDENAMDARRQGLLAFAAVQLFFSQISMVVMPRQISVPFGGSAPTTPGFEDGGLSAASTPYSAHFPRSDNDARLRNMNIPSSSPVLSQLQMREPTSSQIAIPSWLPSSSQDDGLGGGGGGDSNVLQSLEGGDGDELEPGEAATGPPQEDPVISRLRQYAKSIRTEPPRTDGELRLLSHWQLGSDPDQFHWVPLGAKGEAEEEMRRQAQEARDRRRKRMEKRAMRDRDRLLMLGGGVGMSGIGSGTGLTAVSSPAVPRIQPSSQIIPIPSQIMSSQVMAGQGLSQSQMPIHHGIMSSQAGLVPPSSQVFSSQVMPSSQPAIHIGSQFSQRPKKKKKPKVARGFK